MAWPQSYSPQPLTQVLHNTVLHLVFSHPLPEYYLVQRVCLALQQTQMMTTPLCGWLWPGAPWMCGTLFTFLPGFARGISRAAKKTSGKFKLSCTLMKVRIFSFPDMEVYFLLKERPSPEEAHSIPPSALAAPTEILCTATGSGLQVTNYTIPPNRAISWACCRQLRTMTLQEAATHETTGVKNGECKKFCNLHSAVHDCKTTGLHFWPWTDKDLWVFQQPVCLEQPGNAASPNHMRLPTATTR